MTTSRASKHRGWGNAGQNGAPAQGEAPASSSANFFQADFQEESQTSAGQEDLFANFSTGMSAAQESQTADLLNIGGGSDRVAPFSRPECGPNGRWSKRSHQSFSNKESS